MESTNLYFKASASWHKSCGGGVFVTVWESKDAQDMVGTWHRSVCILKHVTFWNRSTFPRRHELMNPAIVVPRQARYNNYISQHLSMTKLSIYAPLSLSVSPYTLYYLVFTLHRHGFFLFTWHGFKLHALLSHNTR